MAIYRCTTKDIYLLVNCFKSPRRRAIQKTKTNRLDSNEQRTQQKPHNGGRHEPFTVRFLSSLSNKHTHLSKQIRNNAIAIASTRQKKKQKPNWIMRWEDWGRRRIVYRRLAEITDGGGYDLQTVSIGTNVSGGREGNYSIRAAAGWRTNN